MLRRLLRRRVIRSKHALCLFGGGGDGGGWGDSFAGLGCEKGMEWTLRREADCRIGNYKGSFDDWIARYISLSLCG